MIDLHSHILPEVDDGADSLDEAVRMALIAVEDGIEAVVATPHVGGSFQPSPSRLEAQHAKLRDALQLHGLPLRILPGSEAFLSLDLGARVAEGRVPRLNGSRYVLVEWPLHQYPAYAGQALFDLRVRGYVPVLAHAERYRIVQSDVNLLVRLIETGTLVQVTAASLLGGFGPAAKRAAEIMLEHEMAHVIASDAHSAANRPPLLSRAVARASELVGEKAARALTVDVPRALVEDQPVRIPAPRPYHRRPFWAFWRQIRRHPNP